MFVRVILPAAMLLAACVDLALARSWPPVDLVLIAGSAGLLLHGIAWLHASGED